jgi:DNA helicase HerA-like ATPase
MSEVKGQTSEKRKYIPPISISSLPKETDRSILLGKIIDLNSKAFFDIDQLTKHTVIVGGSGTGKTIAGMVIAEECLLKKVAVVVFTPTKEWNFFGSKCDSGKMLRLYKEFGLSEEDRKEFNHRELVVSCDDLNIDVTSYVEEGKINVFVLDELTENDYNEFVKNSLESMMYKNWETTDKLKVLLVFENAYKLLPSFGNKAALMLEKACREFRKYGIGILLITHSFSDFGPAVLGNVASEIWFKTSYDRDLDRITHRYGPEYRTAVVRLRTGECMIANVEYNYSKPWFIKFRPLYHKFQ